MKRGMWLLVAIGVVAAFSALLPLFSAGDDGPAAQVEPGGALPGDPWTGKGRQGLSKSQAERFASYPLYWLGPSYGGFNLQAILDAPSDVTFIYGGCRLRSGPEPSCPVPLALHLQPVCFVRPEQAQNAYQEPPQTLRGGAVYMRRENPQFGLRDAIIWTGTSLIVVNAGRVPGTLDELLTTLQGMGPNGIAAGAPLPPPDFSRC
ncbi:MAG TPA: hypothetical protein VJB57_04600 [Dehalococcoidia bacterium]|nr:hypothetical protein [Dehalococcoidia bacterium]